MDYFKRVTVRGYRSFKNEESFELAFPAGEKHSGYNVIVGPNNSGKSSVLNLLGGGRWASQSDDDFYGDEGFIAIESALNKKMHARYRKYHSPRVEILPIEGSEHPNINLLYFAGRGNASFRSRSYPGNAMANTGGAANALFASLQTVSSAQQGSDENVNIIGILHTLQEKGLKDEFLTFLRSFVEDFGDYHVSVHGDGSYEVEYKDKAGQTFDPIFLSDGSKSLLLLCALTFFFEKFGAHAIAMTPLPSVLIIDEPERSLQPHMQKKLYRLLRKLAMSIQVIVATHSPYFVDWLSLKDGAYIHRVYKDASGSSKVGSIKSEDVDDDPNLRRALASSRQAVRMHHYDPLSREVLFSNNCLLVEGQEDALIIRRFIEDEDLDVSFEVFGYGADGAGNIAAWVNVLRGLGIRTGALFDGNKSGDADGLSQLIGSDAVRVLPTDDIRDKDAASYPEVTGIATKRGEIKAEYIDGFKLMLEELSEGIGQPKE